MTLRLSDIPGRHRQILNKRDGNHSQTQTSKDLLIRSYLLSEYHP